MAEPLHLVDLESCKGDGIPQENRVLTSLILGYPKYKYKKCIRRDLAGVQRM